MNCKQESEALKGLGHTCRRNGGNYEIKFPWIHLGHFQKKNILAIQGVSAAYKTFREIHQENVKLDENLQNDLEEGYVKSDNM